MIESQNSKIFSFDEGQNNYLPYARYFHSRLASENDVWCNVVLIS